MPPFRDAFGGTFMMSNLRVVAFLQRVFKID